MKVLDYLMGTQQSCGILCPARAIWGCGNYVSSFHSHDVSFEGSLHIHPELENILLLLLFRYILI